MVQPQPKELSMRGDERDVSWDLRGDPDPSPMRFAGMPRVNWE